MQWSHAATLQLETERSFTMVAEAGEYRESVAMSKMSPEEREKYSERQELTRLKPQLLGVSFF